MNINNRAIREYLRNNAPNKMVDFVKSCNLPKQYEDVIIELDIKRISMFHACDNLNVSLRTLMRNHNKGLDLIYKSLSL